MADMKARILWIEGKRADSPSFVNDLRKKDFFVVTVPTGSEALERVADLDPDLVVVNAPSLRSNGKRICRALRDKYVVLPIVLIVAEAKAVPADNCANVVLMQPFTVRKLLNRIAQFIPGNGEHMLHVGHLRLDLERRQVRCQGKEVRLTPRMSRLLQILMQHPGEVMERGKLFREVWNTEYTGDTRTLDVHISWLREAIEEDPRKPRFLITIRRVGYRLDAS
jgi:DNA-binding response OmpR family regulator